MHPREVHSLFKSLPNRGRSVKCEPVLSVARWAFLGLCGQAEVDQRLHARERMDQHIVGVD